MSDKATPVVAPSPSPGPQQDPSPLVMQMIQREIEHVTKLTDEKLAGLRIEITTSLEGKSKALDLQAKEYERRLQDLNHAHRQAVERYATFLPREIYEENKQGFEEWRRIVDAERATNTGQRTAYLSVFSTAMSLLALLFVAYGLWR